MSHLNQAKQMYFQLITNQNILQYICSAILCVFMKVFSPKLTVGLLLKTYTINVNTQENV